MEPIYSEAVKIEEYFVKDLNKYKLKRGLEK